MPTSVPDDNLAIALVNTVKTTQPPADLLDGPGALASFWRRQREANADVVALPMQDSLELRSLVTQLLTALCRGEVPAGEVLEAANRLLDAAPERLELLVGEPGSPVIARRTSADGTPEGTRGEVIRSAIELLPMAAEGRLRECAADDCAHVFVAANAKRQWCQERCGNRVRVARHAARVR